MDSGDAEAPDSAPHPAGAIEGRDVPEQTDPARDHPDPAPDERDEQIAEHVRYRLSVDASYKAAEARSSWTEAAPVLRADVERTGGCYPTASGGRPRATFTPGLGELARRRRAAASPRAERRSHQVRCRPPRRGDPAHRPGNGAGRGGRPESPPGGRACSGEAASRKKMADELLAPGVRGTSSARQNRRRRPGVHRMGDIRQNATLRVSCDVDRIKAEGSSESARENSSGTPTNTRDSTAGVAGTEQYSLRDQFHTAKAWRPGQQGLRGAHAVSHHQYRAQFSTTSQCTARHSTRHRSNQELPGVER